MRGMGGTGADGELPLGQAEFDERVKMSSRRLDIQARSPGEWSGLQVGIWHL